MMRASITNDAARERIVAQFAGQVAGLFAAIGLRTGSTLYRDANTRIDHGALHLTNPVYRGFAKGCCGEEDRKNGAAVSRRSCRRPTQNSVRYFACW
jgi:hypothetical protein